MELPHTFYIIFLFLLGACVGSFLNVVVWRLPRGESLVSPPSRCPRCGHRLAWFDNVPIVGWVLLRGKCRYCRTPISMRYPTVELATALLFVGYYVCFFMMGLGPCETFYTASGEVSQRLHLLTMEHDWPIYLSSVTLISGLLAISLIDADLMIIPSEIPWFFGLVGLLAQTFGVRPEMPGSLHTGAAAGIMAAGGAVGLLISLGAWWKGWIPTSFPQGEPILEADRPALSKELDQARRDGREMPPLPPEYTRGQIRSEIRKEMLFLLPPMVVAVLAYLLYARFDGFAQAWEGWIARPWLAGMLGSMLGALVGGWVVWLARILGTLGFGRLAMGLGDVHLMFGVGAVIGAGAVTVSFFLAPVAGLAIALWLWFSGSRREIPFGPYLALASAFVVLFYCPIEEYLAPGLMGLGAMIRQWMGS